MDWMEGVSQHPTTSEIQASKAAMIGRNMKYLLAVIMLLVCLPMESRAAFDGNWLSRTCGGDNDLSRYVCESWILGFQSGIATAYAESRNMHICLPKIFDGNQAVVIVKKYVKAHPDELHLNAQTVTIAALLEAFPCTK